MIRCGAGRRGKIDFDVGGAAARSGSRGAASAPPTAEPSRPDSMPADSIIVAPAAAVARRLRAALRGGYRSLRKPVVRALRDVPWYRRLARLPRNDTVTPRQAAAAAGGRFVVVHAPSDVLLPFGEREQVPPRFAAVARFTTPETFVAELRDARLYGRAVAVIAADGRVVTNVTVHLKGKLEDHNVMGRLRLPPPERLAGTTAVLSAPGGNTYFHWLFDILPRLELLRLAGYDLAVVDRFAVNATRHGFQRETLERLGVAEGRVLQSDRARHVECERMLLPSFPGTSDYMPRWVCDYLVRTLLDPAPADGAPAPERLYVSRQGGRKRRIHNAPEVEALLQRLGFATVYPERHTVAEQARLFHGARVVVGLHGSGFANLVFCRPGAALVELHEPHPTRTTNAYWVLTRQCGVRYYGLEAPRAPSAAEQDLVVDARVLEATLRRAIAEDEGVVARA